MTETDSSDLADSGFPSVRGCPFAEPAEYAQLRERAPINKVRLVSGMDSWWASAYEESRAILADRRFSSDRNREGFPNANIDKVMKEKLRRQPQSMIGMDGAEHAAARKAVLGEFTARRMTALRPRIQQLVDDHIDIMLAADERPVDLVQALSLPVPSLVICELLGVPYADRDFFQSRTTALLRLPENSEALAETSQARQRYFGELQGYFSELIARKEAEPGDDLFSRVIAKQHEEGTVDYASLVSMAILLVIAGHETTANMISLGVAALLEHSQQLELIKADPSKTPMAVDEVLRYFAILAMTTSRVATEDVRIGGVTIKENEGVVVSTLSANWDPTAFENPSELNLERDARHHLSFGYGPHRCIGENLARLELQIVFDTLFSRIPNLRLAAPVSDISFKADSIVYGAYDLPVTW